MAILVVDDDPSLTRLLAWVLTDAGYLIVEANHVADAAAAVDRRTPELLIMDLEMPGCDTQAFCRRLRTDQRTLRMPILAMSGRDPEAAMHFPADAFLQKPFLPDDLLELVRACQATDGPTTGVRSERRWLDGAPKAY